MDDVDILIDALDHINDATACLELLSYSDTDIAQWQEELSDIHAAIESRIKDIDA